MRLTIIGGCLAVACATAFGGVITFSEVQVTLGNTLGPNGPTDAIFSQYTNGSYSAGAEICLAGSCSVPAPPLNLPALRLTNTFVDCMTVSPCGAFDVSFVALGHVTGPVNMALLLDNINWDVGPELVQGTFSAYFFMGNGPAVATRFLNFDSSATSFGPTPAIAINATGNFALDGYLHFDSMPGNDFMGLPDSGIVEFTGTSGSPGTPEPATVWLVLTAGAAMVAKRRMVASRSPHHSFRTLGRKAPISTPEYFDSTWRVFRSVCFRTRLRTRGF